MNDDRFQNHALGQDREEFRISGRDELRAASLAMACQCRRSLEIISRQLDPAVYDSQAFSEALRQLALQSQYARIRILVLEPAALVSRGHRLLELAGRLSSFFELRVPGSEHQGLNEACLIADGIGAIHLPVADRYEGRGSFSDHQLAGELGRHFEEIWAKAQPDPNLRRLKI